MFSTYLQLGLEHISDWAAYDHILFLVALCAVFEADEFKKILLSITAFTLGHSLTLALASLKIIPINSALVEFLIPVTILLTALGNVFEKKTESRQSFGLRYAAAAFFGLIHGMGFSNFLSAMLGQESSIVMPLFAFNIGLEIGQILIVGLVILLSLALKKIGKMSLRERNLFLSGAAAGIALTLIGASWYW